MFFVKAKRKKRLECEEVVFENTGSSYSFKMIKMESLVIRSFDG